VLLVVRVSASNTLDAKDAITKRRRRAAVGVAQQWLVLMELGIQENDDLTVVCEVKNM
jgi:hypothetical protein